MKNIYVRITAWLAGPFSSKISKFTQNAYVMAIQNGFQTVFYSLWKHYMNWK